MGTDMTKTVTLTIPEFSTVTIALQAWAARCDREAASMDDYAKAYSNSLHLEESRISHDKCLANATASRSFAEQARELHAKLTAPSVGN